LREDAEDAEKWQKWQRKRRGKRRADAKRISLMDRTPKESVRAEEMMWDRSPSGGKSGLVFMNGSNGSFVANPAEQISYWLRRKLEGAKYRRPDVTVYDAAGNPIAIIDGETRERRPYDLQVRPPDVRPPSPRLPSA
jgi:alpha-L-fucosidase